MVRYQLHRDVDGVDENTNYIEERMNSIAVAVSEDYGDDIQMEDADELSTDGQQVQDDDYNSGSGEEGSNEEDEEEEETRDGISRALTTHTGNALARPGTTIEEHHYHIYYTPPPEYYNDGLSSSCCGRWICRIVTSWWFVAMIALSFQIIYNYGPPAAPPVRPADGPAEVVMWPEFLNHQFDLVKTLAKTWGHELPVHVSSWCWQGLRDDVFTFFNHPRWRLGFGGVISQPSNPSRPAEGKDDINPQHCMWDPQIFQRAASNSIDGLSLSHNRLRDELRDRVFGQDLAIDMVHRTITARGDLLSSTVKDTTSPIFLYFTGGPHVGKTQLATSLSQLLFSAPAAGTTGWERCNFDLIEHEHGPILTLHSADIAKEIGPEKHFNAILEHIQVTAPVFGGAVVIVTHAEELPPGVFNRIVRRLSYAVESATTTSSHPNTLVIFTSNVASRVIQKSIQMYGGVGNIPASELQAFLSHHVDIFHRDGGSEQKELSSSPIDDPDSSTPTSMVRSLVHDFGISSERSLTRLDHHLILQFLDAIVPFFPLGRPELGLVLQDQLRNRINNEFLSGKRLDSGQRIPFRITASAMESTLEHVEFHTWLHKTTQQAILTFSPSGAKPVISNSMLLSNLSDRLIRDCLLSPSSRSNDMSAVVQEGCFVLDTVLDQDSVVDDGFKGDFQKQYVLRGCIRVEDNNRNGRVVYPAEEEDFTRATGYECSEVCRFLL